jgi:hypothetical protein
MNKQVIRILSIFFLFCLALLPKESLALTVSPVRIEFSGNPGETVSGKVKVTNSEPKTKTLFTNIYNFEAKDESGNPSFKVVKNDLATWVNIDSQVTLGPNESKSLDFTANIPGNAEPGGYFAAVFFSETPPKIGEGGDVSISSEVGCLLLLRVNGDVKEGADILEFGTKDNSTFFNSLPVGFYFRFQNSGQDRVRPVGDIVVRNMFGRNTKILSANKNDGNVLPQSIRRFENVWTGPSGEDPAGKSFFDKVFYQMKNFALGRYSVSLNLAYGGNVGLHSAMAKTAVWVLPWQLMLVVIILLLILFYSGRYGLRRYNRWIITQARAANSYRRK